VIAALGLPELAEAALRNAAGGSDGGGGFAALTRYLDRLATFLIPVGGAAAVLGVILGGVQFIAGNPAAAKTLGYVAVGVVIVLASKGLAA
jgi:type IV secretory pathway VirB2 component (pilin)